MRIAFPKPKHGGSNYTHGSDGRMVGAIYDEGCTCHLFLSNIIQKKL